MAAETNDWIFAVSPNAGLDWFVRRVADSDRLWLEAEHPWSNGSQHDVELRARQEERRPEQPGREMRQIVMAFLRRGQ